MTITAPDIDEMIAYIRADPALRERFANAIFEADMRELPGAIRHLEGIVADYAQWNREAQARWEETTQRIDARLAEHSVELAAINSRLGEHTSELTAINWRLTNHDAKFEAIDARFDAVDARFDAIDARFDAVDARLDGVDVRFDAMDVRFDGMDRRMDRMSGQIGNLEGGAYEDRYINNASSRLSKHSYRAVRRYQNADIPGLLVAFDSGRITDEQWNDVMLLDLAVVARRRGENSDIIVAVELSRVVDEMDVIRARRRADILRMAGFETDACVDGESIIPAAIEKARELQVAVLVANEAAATA